MLYVVGTLEESIITYVFNYLLLLLVGPFKGFAFSHHQALALFVVGTLEGV